MKISRDKDGCSPNVRVGPMGFFMESNLGILGDNLPLGGSSQLGYVVNNHG